MQNNDVIITSVKPLSLSHILSSFPNKILNKVNNQFTSDTLGPTESQNTIYNKSATELSIG